MTLKSPIGVNLKLTNRCNLFCDHCIAQSAPNDILLDKSAQDYMDLIQQLYEHDVFFIDFTGGEPFVYPHWYDVAMYAKSLDFDMSFSTNATLIDSDIVTKLIEIKPNVVKVSLDGASTETHSLQRVGMPSAFQRTIRGIKMLKAANIPVTVIVTISRRNIFDMESIVKLCIELSVDAINYFPLVPAGRGENLREFTLSPIEMKNLYAEIFALTQKYRRKILFKVKSPLYNVWLHENMKLNEDCGFYSCLASKIMLFVNESGDAFPCPLFPTSVGNLFNEGLDTVWQRHSLLDEISSKANQSIDCLNCESFKFCCGGCRAMTFIKEGTIKGVDPYCWKINYDNS